MTKQLTLEDYKNKIKEFIKKIIANLGNIKIMIILMMIKNQ
jgi:hypothetical protein